MGFPLPLLIILQVLPQAATGMIAGSLMFAVIITALFFLLAAFFQSPNLKAVANEELAALIFTAFIIMFWVTSEGVLNGITNGIVGITVSTPGTAPHPFSVTHVDLAIIATDIFRAKMQNLYINLYLYEVLIGFLSTISFPIGTIFPGATMISFSLMPFISLSMLSAAHTSVVEAIGLVMAMIWAKEFILLFCRDIIPLILLPIGIVLRAFPLSRTTGSSIIAVCFVGYFVFPLASLFSYYLIFDIYEPVEEIHVPSTISLFKSQFGEGDAQGTLDSARAESEKREEMFGEDAIADRAMSGTPCEGQNRFLCSLENIAKWGYDMAKTAINVFKSIWMFMMGLMGDFHQNLFVNPLLPSNVASGLYYFIIKEVTHVSQYLVAVVFTSIIEIIISITMYRNISWIIGGEMELAGITKIV